MSEAPVLSVIVPVYNAAAHLKELLNSIKAQTFADYEVICVNDASTDESATILSDYAAKDSRYSVLNKINEGPGVARNAGLDKARGSYVFFFDSDDIVNSHLFEHAYACAQETNADIIIYQSQHLDDRSNTVYPSPDRWDPQLFPKEFNSTTHADALFETFQNWPWDKMFKRSFLLDNEIRFPALYRTEDLAFTCAALAMAQRIALLDEVLYSYRVNNPASSTQTTDNAPCDFITSIIELKSYLDRHHVFKQVERSYVNWTSLCIAVNLAGLHSPATFSSVCNELRSSALERTGLAQASDDLFDNTEIRKLIRTIENQDDLTIMMSAWHVDRALITARQDAYIDSFVQEGMNYVRQSTTFRTGKALLALPTFVKEHLGSSAHN